MMDPKFKPLRSNSDQSKLTFSKVCPVPGVRLKPMSSSGFKKFPVRFRKWYGFGRKSKLLLALYSDVISGSMLLGGYREKKKLASRTQVNLFQCVGEGSIAQ